MEHSIYRGTRLTDDLKVLGLSVEEAIIFWRKSFSGMTDDKFNKEYKYNIRHSYGLEGRRANYPARRSWYFSWN
jgi:DNA primase large subunit